MTVFREHVVEHIGAQEKGVVVTDEMVEAGAVELFREAGRFRYDDSMEVCEEIARQVLEAALKARTK